MGDVQEKNKATYRRTIDAMWNRGELSAVDELTQSGYRGNDPAISREGGAQRLVEIVRILRAATEGLRYTIDEVIAEGDLVAARWTVTAKVTGRLFGAEGRGRQVKFTGMSFNHFVDGRSQEGWIQWDVHGLLGQLGVCEATPRLDA